MSIREYAKRINYPIVGKLKRCEDTFGKKYCETTLKYLYVDEAGSEFWVSKRNVITIITPDGGVL